MPIKAPNFIRRFKIEWIVIIVFFISLFLIRLNLNMRLWINHDEHQFISAGKLIASNGLLPYSGFEFHHMPYLSFVYAAVFLFTDNLILSARLISTVTSIITFIFIFIFFRNKLSTKTSGLKSIILPIFIILLILFNSSFIYTSGYSWNYDFPMLFSILSYLMLVRIYHKKEKRNPLILIGILAGIATCSRLSFGPLLIPMFIATFFFPDDSYKIKLRNAGFFVLGVLISIIPFLGIVLYSPEHFFFHVFGYHFSADPAYLDKMGHAITVIKRWHYLFDKVLSPTYLVLLIIFFGLLPYSKIFRRSNSSSELFGIRLILLSIPFLIYSSLGKVISLPQYFYAPVFYLSIGVGFIIVHYKGQNHVNTVLNSLLLVAVLFSFVFVFNDYKKVHKPLSAKRWYVNYFGQNDRKVKNYLSGGKILTLSPTILLEDGFEIYPEFATGPFGWRTSKFVSPDKRKKFDIVTEENLDQFLDRNPPDAIYTGPEKGAIPWQGNIELAFEEYAESRNYKKIILDKEYFLYLNPSKDDTESTE